MDQFISAGKAAQIILPSLAKRLAEFQESRKPSDKPAQAEPYRIKSLNALA